METLEVDEVRSGYGSMEVLHGVSLTVSDEEIVTIIGPNGAGKSTLLKTVMGYLTPTSGEVVFSGEEVSDLRPDQKVQLGIGYVPQLDNVFPSLTVKENLEMGGYLEERSQINERADEVYRLFPILEEKKTDRVKTMSGGQRQMVAMGRALMADPDLILLDEPSAGLAPKIADEIFELIETIHEQGAAITIVEQDAYRSLEISDTGYVLAMGENEFTDDADKVLSNEEIKEAYLGQ